MYDCDMVIWQANEMSSQIQDLYSFGLTTPSIDAQQDYVTSYSYDRTFVNFTSDRALITGDDFDFDIPIVNINLLDFHNQSYRERRS